MKNITLLVAFLVTIAAGAQDFTGKRPELLKGKEVKIMPLPAEKISRGYSNFYTDTKMSAWYAANSSYNTTADSLVGRTFRVENVEIIESGEDVRARITLKDAGGTVMYYSYHSRLAKLPFYAFEVVGGITLPADLYCDDIQKKPAQIGGDEYTTNRIDGVLFIKNNLDGASAYRMQVRMLESAKSRMFMGKITVTLENGKVITKELEKVQVEDNGYGSYICTAEFFLKEPDIDLLAKNKILLTQIDDMETKVTDPNRLKAIYDCLLTK